MYDKANTCFWDPRQAFSPIYRFPGQEEVILGIHGIETRYPFISARVVQATKRRNRAEEHGNCNLGSSRGAAYIQIFPYMHMYVSVRHGLNEYYMRTLQSVRVDLRKDRGVFVADRGCQEQSVG